MRIAVFDVGGTFIKHALMIDDVMTSQDKVSTPCDTQKHFLETIKSVLQEMGEVEGIAFSLPGVIDVERKYIHAGGSLTYNNHTDIHEWEDYFQLPITVENDARCAAIAELECGHMQGIQQGLVLTFGTGVGGGIILNGEIYKGHHLIAGEVSVIYSKDPKQYQSKGLFGAIGSIYNLVDKIAKAKNSETHDGKEVFNWIGAGDKMSQQIFKDYCDEVVLEFHNIQCLLDPERICIGGGISENPLFIAGLQRASDEFYQRFPIAFPHAEIVKCQYCNDANMLGAYYHYKKTTMKV